jgi:hypothetical protein
MKTTVALALSILLVPGGAWACAPEVQAVAVASKPTTPGTKHAPRTIRTLWHGGLLLSSLEVLGPCAPSEPAEVVREVRGSRILVHWAWAPGGFPTNAPRCLRQVDVTLYGLAPATNYSVHFEARKPARASCQ